MKVSAFFKHVALLFLALRAADIVNVAAGMWIVPLFVRPEDLGAVLPFVTFATTLATPAFAFAFVLMRESNRLAGERAFGRLKSLLAGSFIGTSALVLLALAVSACFIPHFTAKMKTGSSGVVFVALAAAFLGSFAPVYQDALNGLKRFGLYGLTEVAAALARVGTMLVVMPFNALLGFFCGNAMQPLARIAGTVAALSSDLRVPSERYWTRPVLKRLSVTYLGVLACLLPPMFVSFCELSLVRTLLPSDVSGAYYLETRLTDILGYLTLPILLVLFPVAAEAAREGRSTRPLVERCGLAAGIGTIVLAVVYGCFGRDLLALFPNADSLTFDAETNDQLLLLLGINLTGAFQTFYTNAEIAAGRFRFLRWFVPLHAAYYAFLATVTLAPDLTTLLLFFYAFGVAKLAFVLWTMIWWDRRESNPEPTV